MTVLGKIFRTTAFKLSLAYLAIFALGAAFVLSLVSKNMKQLFDDQVEQTVQAEITGLGEQYNTGGIVQLVNVIERRSRQPGSSLYLLTTPAGETLAGNVAVLPATLLDQPGLVEIPYQRFGEENERHYALAEIIVLRSGFRLLVGRDLAERNQIRQVVLRAQILTLLYLGVIGTLGGLFVARRVLRRVDGMNATARTIMVGDLSGRLPTNGSGDELDRLADSLNSMLTRIAGLMTGLKEVSDNIAHDLKTPLTRLRNGAEQALRTAATPAEYRQALIQVIEESDGLIRVFNALLMIARAETGASMDGMAQVDLGRILEDVAELYEPIAEAHGQTLRVSVEPGLFVYASRELISQALANLIDNALKYAKSCGEAKRGAGPAEITLAARAHGPTIEIIVADRGPGIAAADRNLVLERFVRLEAARSLPGSGLGLSLAAAVARLHHGSLQLEDNEPGLRVVMRLPKLREPAVLGRAVASEAT